MINIQQSKLVNRKEKSEKITSIKRNKNTTHNLKPRCFRFTENDMENLESLVKAYSTVEEPLTAAKILRALISFAKEEQPNLNKYKP